MTDALKAAPGQQDEHTLQDYKEAILQVRRLKERIAELEASPAAQPELTTCNCRWDGETQVQQCTLHEAHVDAIHEWAERAKTAEKAVRAQPEPDEAGNIGFQEWWDSVATEYEVSDFKKMRRAWHAALEYEALCARRESHD